MSEQELVSCPFCGSDSVALHPNDLAHDGGAMGLPSHGGFYAHCDGCGAEGPQSDDEAESINAWNRRAPLLAAQPAADHIANIKAAWEFALLDRVDGVIRRAGIMAVNNAIEAASHPNCGACPGDGSVCEGECRVKQESPPVAAQPVAQAAVPEGRSPGDSWEDNAQYMLDRCPYTVWQRPGAGPVDLLASLVVTFMGMQMRLEGHPMYAKPIAAAPTPSKEA